MSSHAGFIEIAYIATAAVLLGTIVAVVLDGRAVRRAIGRLEARGGQREP